MLRGFSRGVFTDFFKCLTTGILLAFKKYRRGDHYGNRHFRAGF